MVVPTEENELIAAIQAGDIPRARRFLDAGGDPNARSAAVNEGTPAIAFAIELAGGYQTPESFQDSSRALLRLLLERGADPDIRWCADDAGCDRTSGTTPLMYASLSFYDDLGLILRQFGADPALRDWRRLTAADYGGVRASAGSLCAKPSADEPHLADARLLATRRASRSDDGYEAILAVRGPASTRPVVASTDDRVCETAARAAATFLDQSSERLMPLQLRPLLVFRIGRLWMVAEPGRPEQGLFDEMWRLLDWYEGPS